MKMAITGNPYALPAKISKHSVNELVNSVLVNYRKQLSELTLENYYEKGKEGIDQRLSIEIKKRLDSEFRTNWNVVVGLRFFASLGLSYEGHEGRSHNYQYVEKTKNGLDIHILVFENNIKEVAYMM